MSAEVSEQSRRLAEARAVLTQVEARQDMRSVSATSLSSFSSRDASVQGLGSGVRHLDGSVQGLAQGLAQVVKAGQYVAVVGVDDVSWDGVAQTGIDVTHVVIIRGNWIDQEGVDQGMKVVASLVEGFSVVVVGDVSLAPRYQRTLAGRARKLDAMILTMHPWPGVSSALMTSMNGVASLEGAMNPLLAYRTKGA